MGNPLFDRVRWWWANFTRTNDWRTYYISPSYQEYLNAYQALPPEARQLSNVLQVNYPLLVAMLNSGKLPPDMRYCHFTKAKKDGTARELAEPSPSLKKAQQLILKKILKNALIHPVAVGFRRKKSIAHHAWAHAGASLIITADIEDFFPRTRKDRVEAWWRTQYEDEEAARILTLLTTYRGGLPQGAPTSPALSNAVNHALDEALAERARFSGGNYTRYADDMVFSWTYGEPPSDFEAGVRSALAEFGYTLHPQKGWQMWDKRDQPQVTGLVLKKNGQVDLPPEVRKIMRHLERSDSAYDASRLAGYYAYESMVTQRPAAERAAPQSRGRRRGRR
jgi:RNA-directed DNA polymerase